MRWTRLDAGTTERFNDVVEDARGRCWIGGQVVRVSDDRGASWRVVFEQWDRSIAADQRARWDERSHGYGEIRGLSSVDGWLSRSSTFENTKADVCSGDVARSRDGVDWIRCASSSGGNCRHRSLDGGAHWSEERGEPRNLSLWRTGGGVLHAHGGGRRWRSTDRGRTWIAGEPELTRLTSVGALAEGSWLAVGDEGLVLHGVDDGTA